VPQASKTAARYQTRRFRHHPGPGDLEIGGTADLEIRGTSHGLVKAQIRFCPAVFAFCTYL